MDDRGQAIGASVLLRPREAAALLGLSISEVYQLARRGELPVVRIGRAVRLHRALLLEWCERQATESGGGGER